MSTVSEHRGAIELFSNGSRLYVDHRDHSIAPWVRRGIWETTTSLALARFLRPGMRCLDVGANCGYFTALMQHCGAQVWAIEPNPTYVRLLRKSVAKSAGWSTSVGVIDRAIGPIDHGTAELHFDVYQSGGGSIEPLPYPHSTVGVMTRTFDSLVAELGGRFDLVKVDIEGGEEALWHFGRRAMASVDVLAMEVCAARYLAPGCFLADIERTFPQLRMIDDQGNIQPISREQIHANAAQIYMLWLVR